MFRGAFGSLLRQRACQPLCEDVENCVRRASCPYAQIFRPSSPRGPSGFVDSPRPFVLRARHLDGRLLQPGEPFHVDVHLFTLAHEITNHFREVFSRFETIGFGPQRSRASLESVIGPSTLDLPLEQSPLGVTAIQVEFSSPTELKHRGLIVEQPTFHALWSRACDRIGTIQALYGSGPLDIDFRGLRDRAHQIRLARHQLHHVDKQRRSSRTGEIHPLGGFIGLAEYEGPLDPFLPFLQAAHWTGVGRQTVWGKGEIAVRSSPMAAPSIMTLTEPQ